MATFPKNHETLYFDALVRTQKAESLLSMIQATYHAKQSAKQGDDVKADIAKRLQYAYALFRNNVKGYDNGFGSYGGDVDQFSSQYLTFKPCGPNAFADGVLSRSGMSNSFATPWTVACQAPLSMGSPR